MINKEQLIKIMPKCPSAKVEGFVQYINTTMAEFAITEKKDIASFVATLAIESGQLNTFSENLNYSTEGLLKIFGKYFTKETAPLFARKPEKIANKVYAGRMGNGNELSGEGWLTRGAGAIQLSGKSNQMKCAQYFGISLDQIGDWLRTDKGAVRSAGFFWKLNNISKYGAVGDTDGVRDLVNIGSKTAKVGDANGYKEFVEFYEKALNVLKG